METLRIISDKVASLWVPPLGIESLDVAAIRKTTPTDAAMATPSTNAATAIGSTSTADAEREDVMVEMCSSLARCMVPPMDTPGMECLLVSQASLSRK